MSYLEKAESSFLGTDPCKSLLHFKSLEHDVDRGQSATASVFFVVVVVVFWWGSWDTVAAVYYVEAK